MSKKLVLFCDFDGTITEKDNIVAIVKKFAPPNGKRSPNKFYRNK